MQYIQCYVYANVVLFSLNDDTEMLTPGWTEVYINALQVKILKVFTFSKGVLQI